VSGPLPAALAPITWPASALYRAAVTWRNRRFDRADRVRRLDVPVVSVGNVTAGGVGKTPFVRWLAAALRDAGRRPVIAMRGYGAAPGKAGDEEREYRDLLPDVPVVAAPDRYAALRAFFAETTGVDVVLLDDGFQHRRLHRDLDLVLIDATRDTPNDRVLPAGYLREPLAGLARADAVVITHAAATDADLAAAVVAHHGRPPLAWTDHRWREIRRIDGAGATTIPVASLAGLRVVTLLGVGNPDAVRAQLGRAGATIVADVPARDHARHDARTLDRLRTLARGTDAIVVTWKDWVKLRDVIDSFDWPAPLLVPIVDIEIVDGETALLDLVRSVTPVANEDT